MELFEDFGIHLHPRGSFVLNPSETIFDNRVTSQSNFIIQGNFIVLLLGRRIAAFGIGPQRKRLLYQMSTPFLELFQSPVLILCDLLVHLDAALDVAVWHGLLLLERAIAVLGVVGSECQISQTMEPFRMDRFCFLSEFACPSRGQLLRHDVLNGVFVAIKSAVDFLIFAAITILKALEQICLIPGRHSIDVLCPEAISKNLISGERSLFLLGCQHILHLLDEHIVGTIKTLDIGTKRQKHLSQSIGG